jgi:tripartite-type tricarboxylate transporter receptor subunit TctC
MRRPAILSASLAAAFGLALAGIALLEGVGSALAEDYPSHPIRIIVPFGAGGSTDIAARLVANALSQTFGQQVYVENKSGAEGNIGLEAAAKAAPDGYTILVATDSVSSSPHLFKLAIDPLRDLIPIAQVSRQPVVLAVNPALGVSSVAELVALAKKQPGMTFAASGIGSQQHIVGEWFAKIAGIELTHVPFRGGGEAANDLLAGHVMIASLGSSPLMPFYKAGQVRLLAQSTATRSPTLPDVPTYQEAGIAGLEMEQWVGAFVPTGTPPEIVARLNAALNKALADPDLRERFSKLAQEPVGGTSEQFARLVQHDSEKYARLIEDLRISTE